MAKKVTLDSLEAEIKGILDEYGNKVRSNLTEITKAVTKQGVQALKSESKAKFGTTSKRKKKYANTWTSSMETTRVSAQGTLYNTQPGLPHLLENGHVSRNGTGRTFGIVKGREHISSVENELETVFMREIEKRL